MVEYRLAKARVAGSNPVSRLVETVGSPENQGLLDFFVLNFVLQGCHKSTEFCDIPFSLWTLHHPLPLLRRAIIASRYWA